jgi:hypothetical protein
MAIVFSVISVDAVSKYRGAVVGGALKHQLRRFWRRFGKKQLRPD